MHTQMDIELATNALVKAPEWARAWPFEADLTENTSLWLEKTLGSIRAARAAEYVLLAQSSEGLWVRAMDIGKRQPLPTDLLATVLDSGEQTQQGAWWAAMLPRHGEDLKPRQRDLLTSSQAVLALWNPNPQVIPQKTLQALTDLLGVSWAIALSTERMKTRVRKLEAMLLAAREWNRMQETVPLLHKIAQAASELLDCDRVSIFLWDKAAKTLVGRPALGVPGGELRVPDDRGLVGKVLASGQPGRVDVHEGQEVIDRRVDQTTGYVTRTLLAVPLYGGERQPLGVFEAINKRQGNFTEDDQELLAELASHAAVALQNTRTREQLLTINHNVAAQAAAGIQMVGECPAVVALRNTIKRVAETDLAVLILGENGTGKEVVSRAIHYGSPRKGQPFVAVNCAAIAETLLESELFGHEKGAFTDAHSTRQGKFELATGGTLFLDEIGDLSLAGQAKLLRVLEDKIVVRVGGSLPIATDVRLIAATNQDLAGLVREKRFREDLYYRLNVVTLDLPPLRMRGNDVLLLAEFFLHEFSRRAGRAAPQLDDDARARLLTHHWPGNVRELRNQMERIAFMNSGERVGVGDLFLPRGAEPLKQAYADIPAGLTLTRATDEFQAQYIEQTIDASDGRMSEAAKRLGLHRSNLYRKMRQLGINTQEES